MLITFKTLEQKTFKIEIGETEKVKTLKEKIAEDRGADQFPASGQKLIYSGKILDDEKSIAECNIDEKNFVVVMVVKPKAKPAEKPKESSAAASSSAAATSLDAPASPMAVDASTASTTSTQSSTDSVAQTPSSESTTTTSESTDATTGSAESALLTGSALESSITELMNLGYPREQVMRALNRSFHNADRAAEYLLSGNIPEDIDAGDVDDVPATGVALPAAGGGGGAADLSFLRDLPQFQMMRQQLQSNPESLPALLQQIGASNPQLLQLISQNQEAFISILNERGDAGADAPAGGDQGAAGGQPFQIQVTASEKEAIDRIVGMGFSEADVIQAFFACDKNEQLAIDFLLSDF